MLSLLPIASLTDPIVDFAVDFIDKVGVIGIFILMTLESACIPIPSEATMLFAGFNVSEGDMTLIGITAAGVLGNLLGSWIAYAIGYYGRLELLERHKILHVNPKHLAAADRWFERHGDATVFWCRMLPIVRTFISLPAGVARMPFWRFTLLTLLGCVPWVLGLGLLGKSVGSNWTELQDKLHYFDYVVAAAIVAGGIYLLVRRRRGKRGADAGADSGAGDGEPADAGA